MFALIEEEQSEELAAEIASVLLNMSEGEILHMLRSREALDAQVHRAYSVWLLSSVWPSEHMHVTQHARLAFSAGGVLVHAAQQGYPFCQGPFSIPPAARDHDASHLPLCDRGRDLACPQVAGRH